MSRPSKNQDNNRSLMHGTSRSAPPSSAPLRAQASVYLRGHGTEERSRVASLHDEAAGVVMSMHCSKLHGSHLLPENAEFCRRLQNGTDAHDYESLMNTTFGLVPSGRSPATYRLGEVMRAGVIPVLVARDVVLPFREQLDWPSFSFAFAPDQVGPDMISALREVPRLQLEEMQVGWSTSPSQKHLVSKRGAPCRQTSPATCFSTRWKKKRNVLICGK